MMNDIDERCYVTLELHDVKCKLLEALIERDSTIHEAELA